MNILERLRRAGVAGRIQSGLNVNVNYIFYLHSASGDYRAVKWGLRSASTMPASLSGGLMRRRRT
jgi:hypothetical protein